MDLVAPPIAFDNRYARLPETFYARVAPTPVAAPRLLALNASLADALGLDAAALAAPGGVAMLAGNLVPDGAEPIATVYAGHQFGHWVPRLGDGRAILLGEVVDRAGRRQDIQLKGAGRTPYSRGGDGRAWIGPVLREYVVSEAMAALGVPTTRALAAVATGESVLRESGPLPGAVLTRVARSHLRVGTFQYFIARGEVEAVGTLVDYAIERHYPDLAEAENRALALLGAVVAAQAELVARWQAIGFVHGVMNTDNTAIGGDTIDYGPCAFIDHYAPERVFSSIDVGGRYAYENQPRLAQWNLANLARCLLPLIDEDPERAVEPAQDAIDGFADRFREAWAARFREKLGLVDAREDDAVLAQELLETMAAGEADFTLVFRGLCGDPAPTRTLFSEPERFDAWHARWRSRIASDPRPDAVREHAMKRANPAVIPRNHRVEEMIRAATEDDDLGPLGRLVATLAEPFADEAERSPLAVPPRPEERVTRTFCGT